MLSPSLNSVSYLHKFWKIFGLPAALGLSIALLVLVAQFAYRQLNIVNEHPASTNYPTDAPSESPLPSLAPSDTAGDLRVSYADAVARAAPAVVNIYTSKKVPRHRSRLSEDPLFRHFFNNADQFNQQRMQSTLGSGVIVSESGYILTNKHVIDNAVEIIVLLHDGRESRVDIVGSDQAADIAVLKVDLPNLTPIPLGNPHKTRIGDVVLAIGNPHGVGQTVTQGIISAKGRYGLGLNLYEDYIQTDAAINPGNSGGALVNAYGELIGINTAILNNNINSSNASVGISFAIPSSQAMDALDSIVTYGRVVRGWLGINAGPLNFDLALQLGLNNNNGVVVEQVWSNSPAVIAGIRVGDVITHIDEMPIGDGQLGMLKVGKKRPGEEAILTVVRNGEKLVLKARLIERPKGIDK